MSDSLSQIPNMQGIFTYNIGGIPLVAYLGIGITTVCLAAVTFYESTQSSDSSNENKSFLYDLPNQVVDTIKMEPEQNNNNLRGGAAKTKTKIFGTKCKKNEIKKEKRKIKGKTVVKNKK